ncbi:MAG: DUF4956 domain-containing protein [Kofleriaceae bacterium]
MNSLFGTDTLFDPEDFWKLVARLGLDMFTATIVIMLVYYRLYRNREMVFTYYAFNVVTFTLSTLLRKTPMDMGFALGLFAIFGILRYRTESIRIRDLTYLFIVLGVAIINAVANKKISLMELLFVNAVIATVTVVHEFAPRGRRCASTPLLYDRLDLLKPEQRAELLRDLRERTGLEVVRVDLTRIDLLRDAAELTLHFHDRSH